MPSDDPASRVHALIAEGETLRDAPPSDSDSNAKEFDAWIHNARDILRELFGHRHGYALDVEEAVHGAAHLGCNGELPTIRYIRVLTSVTLAILHRAAYELHFRGVARRSVMPRVERCRSGSRPRSLVSRVSVVADTD